VATGGDSDAKNSLPWPLPGERALLYTLRTRQYSWGDEEVVAFTLATGERKTLLKDASDARYLPTGHLVFLRHGTLFAVPFDAGGWRFGGAAVPVLQAVAEAQSRRSRWRLHRCGTIRGRDDGNARHGSRARARRPNSRGWWRWTVPGASRPSPRPRGTYGGEVRLSPDGRRLAVTIKTLTAFGPWVYDLGRGTLTPLAGAARHMGRRGCLMGSACCSPGCWMASGRSCRSPRMAPLHRRY